MIVAIYLAEYSSMIPVNTVVPVSKVERVSRDRREHERKRSTFSEVLTHALARRSDNYDSNGQFVEQEQLFNRLA